VGSPIAGRNRAEVENLIGLFLNTLVLRTDLSGKPAFRELLQRVRETSLGAFANQDVPFEMLLDELKPERDLSRTPLFQVFFNMLNFSEGALQLPGVTSEVLANPTLGSKFDLTLYVSEIGPQIKLLLSYNADLFQEARMVEMVEQYEYLLTQIVANPDELIDNYSLVTAHAQSILPDPTEPLSAEWFGPTSVALTRNAQRIPQQIAVVDAQETWTYQELEQRSNQLAHFLCEQGVQPQDVVAIYSHRSASLPWALMGLMKAGAAFLVLDPTYPPARLIDYLELAKPRGWLQLEAAGEPPAVLLQALDEMNCTCRMVLPGRSAAEQQGLLADYSVEPPDIVVGPDDFASLSFTSGSTGKPKGTMGRHGSLTHFYPWMAETFALTEDDRFSMLSGLAHDPLQRDIFTALWVGARICMEDPMQIGSPGWLADWMREQGVTVANLTPAMGQLITDTAVTTDGIAQAMPSLRRAFFVGDVLTRRDVARLCNLAPNLTVVNFYGSTETQRAVSYYIIEESVEELTTSRAKEIVPLGRGVKDAQLILLNNASQLAGIGEVAEIHMRSHHLALRYQGDDAQTAYRFLPNTFTNIPGDRLYRTGDLGRYRPEGDIEFLGRVDFQVKVGGHRIELGEVEA
ncbi:MAG: amino acid adenylation domain-containing protein, partial [Anaerolineales bacterium]|nr:amino acid adenylation domain-containing protein [Anaerolineales bacterium]